MSLEFSSDELILLVRMIDEYIEGTIDAKNLTTEDRVTITNLEDLLSSMSSYDKDLALLHAMRDRILAEDN